MHQTLAPQTVICDDYDQEHPCITVAEVQWLLRACGRHSPYWMYFVLRITTGMRPDEACKLTLYHLSPDCRTITYRVDKPSTKLLKSHEYQERRKHRRVVLDDWTAGELRAYLGQTCRNVNGTFVSPHPGQRLFPWKSMTIVCAYWWKLREKMRAAGFDAHRLRRQFLRRQRVDKVFVIRPHILRHFSASVMQYKLGNIVSVRDWIKHEDAEITNGYLHSAEALGSTPEFLRDAPWPVILGYDPHQQTLTEGRAPVQRCLDNYGT